ncbi:hypothetical protein L484_015804 [Morus notabilis]|uniref:Uncharacterized protein n=1 Tax=Morus notabilis TaxID=981085 RepID=W9RLN9_9ROSA|nr:hypothetical protein L484_015804 [Morus notabilis]
MFNINVRLIAGKRFSGPGKEGGGGEAQRLMKAIKEATYLSGVFPLSDMIPWLECLDIQGHLSSMKRTFEEIDSILGKWVEEHRGARADYCNNRDVESDLMGLMLSNIEENDAMLSGYSRDSVIKATALGFDMKTKDEMPVDMREGLGIALEKLSPLEAVLSPRLPLQLYECL